MRNLRALALVITALSLAMTTAHVLEMPRKLSYSIELYTAVNSTMYLYFAMFGAIFEIGAIIAVAALAWRTHHRPSRHWMLAAAIGSGASFGTSAVALARRCTPQDRETRTLRKLGQSAAGRGRLESQRWTCDGKLPCSVEPLPRHRSRTR